MWNSDIIFLISSCKVTKIGGISSLGKIHTIDSSINRMAIKMLVVSMMLFIAMCLGQKQEVDLEFKEDGKQYKEKIIFDETENTTEYDVPKHGNLEKASYLVDHTMNVQVMKMEDQGKCYLMDLSTRHGNIKDTKQALKKVGGKFPENKFYVENHQFVPTAQLNPMDVPIKFRQFCGKFPIFKVKETTLAEMEKRAQRLVSGQQKRQTNDQLFVFCNVPKFYNPSCTGNKKVGTRCRFQMKSWVLQLTCPIKKLTGWKCVPEHFYNTLLCCDIVCI